MHPIFTRQIAKVARSVCQFALLKCGVSYWFVIPIFSRLAVLALSSDTMFNQQRPQYGGFPLSRLCPCFVKFLSKDYPLCIEPNLRLCSVRKLQIGSAGEKKRKIKKITKLPEHSLLSSSPFICFWWIVAQQIALSVKQIRLILHPPPSSTHTHTAAQALPLFMK